MDTIFIKEIIIGIIMGVGLFVCYTLRQKKYENEATNNSNIGINVILTISILVPFLITLFLAPKWGVQVVHPNEPSVYLPYLRRIVRTNWPIFLTSIITFLLCLFIKRKD